MKQNSDLVEIWIHLMKYSQFVLPNHNTIQVFHFLNGIKITILYSGVREVLPPSHREELEYFRINLVNIVKTPT